MKKKNMLILLVILVVLCFMPTIPVYAYSKVACGNLTGIPQKIPSLTSLAVSALQIAVPIILVIVGSVDLLKAIASQKEDEITKARKVLVKRAIVAAVVFFAIVAVKLLVSVAAESNDSANIVSCMDCFLTGKCKSK